MKRIDLEPQRHSTLIEVQPAPKWVFPLAVTLWALTGWAVYGFDLVPFAFSFCGGLVMLAAVASYPKFFLARDR